MKASVEPEYFPMVQEPYCCVPACVQMVLLRQELPLYSQEEIGLNLGLVVPEEYTKYFEEVETGPEPPSGYGTRINEEEYSLDSFFKKNDLPLRCDFYTCEDIEDIPHFIGENLLQGNDILTCFKVKHLYDIGEAGDSGHASLIQEIDDETLMLVDPHGLYQKVRLERFIEAVKVHKKEGIQLGGFWVISSC